MVVLAGLVAWRSPWIEPLTDPAAWPGSDFEILLAAGVAQSRGLDGHDPAVLDAVGREFGRPTTPFCAAPPLVVAVFGTLGDDLPQAYESWRWVQILAGLVAVGALGAVARRAGLSALGAGGLALGAVALGDGLWMSLAMNSTNLVALAAMALGLLAAVRRRPLLEGLALAVAVVAKTSPALLVLVALFAGRRATVLASGAAMAGLVALGVGWAGWDVHVSWWQNVLPALGYAPSLPPGHFDNGLHQWNLAPHGLLARAAFVGELPRTLVALGAWAVTSLVVVQVGLAVRDRRGREQAEGGAIQARCHEYGLGVAGSLLISSVTWPHHLVFAALPALALALGARRGGWRHPAWVLGALAWLALTQPLGTFGAEGEQPADVLVYAVGSLLLVMALAARPRGAPASARSAAETAP